MKSKKDLISMRRKPCDKGNVYSAMADSIKTLETNANKIRDLILDIYKKEAPALCHRYL